MLGPKAVGNGNVFDIIDEVFALWKAFQYAGMKKNNIPCFAGLVANYFKELMYNVHNKHVCYL